jgi:hypothetical protein
MDYEYILNTLYKGAEMPNTKDTQDHTAQVLDILNYIRLHESTKTTHQLFRYFEVNDQIKHLIYAFPFMVKGHVLAFEMLISKTVVEQTSIDRPELLDADIIESMQRSRY